MLRAMVFIDLENFDISKNKYYKSIRAQSPKLDFNSIPMEIVNLIPTNHELVKTFLFAPKPDEFLMKDPTYSRKYHWINGLRNQNFFSVIEGTHTARPAYGKTRADMDIGDKSTYYVVEKGTDVNLASHVITKGLHNAFDTAVIVSGDTDYIPVMDILNQIGKSVVVVGVKGQRLDNFKQHTDAQIILDDNFFQKCIRL